MDDVLTKPLKKDRLLDRIEVLGPGGGLGRIKGSSRDPGAKFHVTGHKILAVPDRAVHQRRCLGVLRVEHAGAHEKEAITASEARVAPSSILTAIPRRFRG
jgi:hypothetical protein